MMFDVNFCLNICLFPSFLFASVSECIYTRTLRPGTSFCNLSQEIQIKKHTKTKRETRR